MDQLAIARRALEEEITALKAETHRLETVLASIDRPGLVSHVVAPVAATAQVSAPVVQESKVKPAWDGNLPWPLIFKIVQDAGKKGIKALALASQLKKAGVERPTKEQLLDTGKVKVSGKGGGTTYTFKG